MINPHWVTAHGKRILVEELETPGMKIRKTRKQQEFVKVPLQMGSRRGRGNWNAGCYGLDPAAIHGLEDEVLNVPPI